MFKIESKLTMRGMDSVIFGIFFPMGIAIILGLIYGRKLAFDGAEYTFIEQSFGAMISIGICATGLMGIPLTIADYRHRKILKRFQVTPVSPGMLLLAQVSVQFMISISSAVGVYLIVKLFFGYQMRGSIGGFVLSYLLVMLAMYGLGMMVASIAPNLKMANLLCTLLYFPMIFLSGATVPYEVMPEPMQKVMNVLPLTQGIKLLKGFSLGLPPENMLVAICIIGGISVISIVLAVKFFSWE
jgi:ABC-2 type transport system permease protein